MVKFKCFALFVFAFSIVACTSTKEYRSITINEYKSKMKAGWIGQMAGVGWGAPTEFLFNTTIIPENKVPAWDSTMINQQFQDDLYVEMAFLRTLEMYGLDVSIRQAGIDFGNTRFMLWGANLFGRNNIQKGIAPPYSGHPKYNSHADDIDYQIEADFSGLIAPGMPQLTIDLGEKFGRIMNYGDGVYGGQFMGGMYTEAFFEKDITKIIMAGLACIPKESQYAEMVNDVIQWHKKNPKDWQKTWQLAEDKYNKNKAYRKFSGSGGNPDFNVDAKMNGAYVLMGLLYGEGDMDKTITIVMRCGKDSDCNPSSAAGVLATSLGMENLPVKYKTNIEEKLKFSFSNYNLTNVFEVCEMLARQALVKAGGSIEINADGKEVMNVPFQVPHPGLLEQSWQAKEIKEDVNLTKEEKEKIIIRIRTTNDYINVWQAAGPFAKNGSGALDLLKIAFDPETNESYTGWKSLPAKKASDEEKFVNLEKLFGVENSIAYLKTRVWIENDQEVLFEMGSDDGIKVWLNDQVIHENNAIRGYIQGEDVVKTKLLKGWNTVLMKVSQRGMGWSASLVITDVKGDVLKGLKFE